jgi:hypothetical protein
MNAFFKLFENAFSNWFRTRQREPRVTRSHLRQYRHHAAQTAYVPAPRKGWHYEQGDLVRNVGLILTLLALSGCSFLLSGCGQAVMKQIVTDVSKDCDRHYIINVGGMGITSNLSATLDCKASGTTTTTTTTFVPANPASGAVPSGGQ